MTTPDQTNDEWEKEFNKHFPEYFDGAYYEKEDTNLGDELKTFISRIRSEAHSLGRKEGMAEVLEQIEALDYYWQREHQDKVLIRMEDIHALARKHGINLTNET